MNDFQKLLTKVKVWIVETIKMNAVPILSLVVLVLVGLVLYNYPPNDKLNKPINKETKCHVRNDYANQLVGFIIKWKDGYQSEAKASSIIYGQTDDKIYFLGQFNDTLQILPKIMVEDIVEKDKK